MNSAVPIAEIVRSGFVEGHHRGSVVALGAEGSVSWAVGDASSAILPRSANKPLQVLAMLRAGWVAPSEHVALGCASHSGEPFHLDGVRQILAAAGLDDDALGNIVDYPLDVEAKAAMIRAEEPPSRIAMNCSGKHAAMLATCVAAGWPVEEYLDIDHPLQQQILSTFTELTGEDAEVAVDGCGAPLLSASLTGLARAYAALATAEAGPERAVADAIRSHPAFVSGTTRDERSLLAAIPGAIGKFGAEAVYAVALPDGRAWALKIDDGGDRARPVVMAAALVRDGVDALPDVDGASLRATGAAPVLGGGVPVGEIRALL